MGQAAMEASAKGERGGNAERLNKVQHVYSFMSVCVCVSLFVYVTEGVGR